MQFAKSVNRQFIMQAMGIGFGDRNYRMRKVGQNGAFGLVAGLNFYAAVKIIICDIVTQFGYLSGWYTS